MNTSILILALISGLVIFVITLTAVASEDSRKSTIRFSSEGFISSLAKRIAGGTKLSKLDEELKAIGGLSLLGLRLENGLDFMVFKIVLTASVLILCLLLSSISSQYPLALISLMMGWYFPSLVLKRKLRQRKERVLQELPGIIDMLAIAVEAGLTFDRAVKFVVENAQGIVRNLFSQALVEVQAGEGKRQAFQKAGRRSLAEEMRLAMRIVFQAEEQGNPIKDVLLELAEAIREKEKHRIQEKANRLGNTLLIPIMVFMVPPVLVIYLLPALLNLRYLY